jgi:RNA polymerase sigma factor (TIGR02999 family)
MSAASALDVTKLLRDWTAGNRSAIDRLIPVIYEELRHTAIAYMRRERAGHTLQATALINEAYLRVIDIKRIELRDRTHFFALCAQMMRRILVDHARSRNYRKRGGGMRPVTLNESAIIGQPAGELVALDDALSALAMRDPRKACVVELRFFGGLTVEETAAVLEVSTQTVLRDWSISKAWLAREMSQKAHE